MRMRCLVCGLVLAACLILGIGALADVQAGGVTYTVSQADFVSALQSVVPTMGNRLLLVNISMNLEAAAKAPENPAFLMLAVDGTGRAYAPVLFDGTGDYARGSGAGDTSFQALFEVPQGNASYRLAVLTGPQGEVAGYMDLPGMAYSAQTGAGGEVASLDREGYHAQIHGITQSSTAGVDAARQGMKYVWLDVTLTAAGTQDAVSLLAGQWTLKGTDGQEQASLTPTRATGLLSSLPLRLNAQWPSVRGKICFLVPEDTTELTGLAVGGISLDQKLPIGESEASANAQPDADGAYSQGGWKIILHGMRIVSKGTLADPPSGSQYLIVNLTVMNGSTRNIDVSSEVNFSMTDEKGNELTQAWFADLKDTLDTALMPTQSVTGEVAFILPDGTKPGDFRVHLSMLGEPLLIPTAGYIAQ